MDRMFAVAVRDGKDLFLWIRIRRAAAGDIYYMFPSGREGDDWKKYNPHGSLHKDGQLHHKGFNKKLSHKHSQSLTPILKVPSTLSLGQLHPANRACSVLSAIQPNLMKSWRYQFPSSAQKRTRLPFPLTSRNPTDHPHPSTHLKAESWLSKSSKIQFHG
jgi:hypothetical protein